MWTPNPLTDELVPFMQWMQFVLVVAVFVMVLMMYDKFSAEHFTVRRGIPYGPGEMILPDTPSPTVGGEEVTNSAFNANWEKTDKTAVGYPVYKMKD